jgi:hypothetical protein
MTFPSPTASLESLTLDRPFLPLRGVRALSCHGDGGEFQVRSLSSLLEGRRPTMVRVTVPKGVPCAPLEQLVASSAAFGRAFYDGRAPREELRAYHRALEMQLGHARRQCVRPEVERSAAFQAFLSAAGALLGHLHRWVPAEQEDGPETLRMRR